jgi:hypothetical protein
MMDEHRERNFIPRDTGAVPAGTRTKIQQVRQKMFPAPGLLGFTGTGRFFLESHHRLMPRADPLRRFRPVHPVEP